MAAPHSQRENIIDPLLPQFKFPRRLKAPLQEHAKNVRAALYLK